MILTSCASSGRETGPVSSQGNAADFSQRNKRPEPLSSGVSGGMYYIPSTRRLPTSLPCWLRSLREFAGYARKFFTS